MGCGLNKGRLWRSIGLVFILALLAFNFIAVGKYASYPWWHQHDCDSDPLYVAQAVTLVNDGPFDYIHHPGAVVSSGHGFAYRVASAIAGWHPEYLDVRASVPGLSAWELLEDATRLSRWLSFCVFAVLIATFYGFVFWLTRNDRATFLVTFFVATSQVAIWHSRAIRPEIPSLLFSILAGWVIFASARSLARGKERGFVTGSIAFGFFLAIAMLSKIQVLPVITMLLLLGGGLVVTRGGSGNQEETNRRLRSSIILGVIAAGMTPWWGLRKPSFVTGSYLESIGYFDRLVYGSMVESFVPLVAAVFGLSLTAAVAAFFFNRRRGGSRVVDRLACVLCYLHLLEIGAILGVYLVVAPASRTVASYLANTHHLVYGVIANTLGNVFGSGFLHHKAVDGNTVARIFDAHALGDQMLGVNIVWLLVLIAIVAFVRILASKTAERAGYWLVLALLSTGVVMDIVFTLRWLAQFNYYAIFSLVLYGIGMALFLNLEWQNRWVDRGWLRATYGVGLLLVGLLLSHVGFRTYEMVTAPRATGLSDQVPAPMLDSTRAQNLHFWLMFEDSP